MKISRLRDAITTVCFLLLMLLIAMKVSLDSSESVTGPFRAADGDSLSIGGRRLRLAGIDAPEQMQSCVRSGQSWECGRHAKEALSDLIAGATTTCRSTENDKYGRMLVHCARGDLDINREMVRRGMAVAFGNYEAEEAEAKAARIGIWSGTFLRPVEWRKRNHPPGDREVPHVSSFLGRLFTLE